VDRVFLDANVLFAAAYRPDSGLLRLWKVPRVTLVTSDYAIEEARRNLPQPAQRATLDRLAERTEMVRGTFDGVPLPGSVKLPDDDKPILRAAIAARCTCLLTGNLRDFGPYLDTAVGGVVIRRPAAFLAGHK
jgi:predicted nucleic acid-binding protein